MSVSPQPPSPPASDQDEPVLAAEIGLLRRAIQRLADHRGVADHLKILAELRHQVDSLCRALKTERDLTTPADEELDALGESVTDEILTGEAAAADAARAAPPSEAQP